LLKIATSFRTPPDFPDSRKSLLVVLACFSREHIMTTTLVWTGVALWLGFSAFVLFGPSTGPVQVPARSARGVRRNRI
jgi:hypothetical protein